MAVMVVTLVLRVENRHLRTVDAQARTRHRTM